MMNKFSYMRIFIYVVCNTLNSCENVNINRLLNAAVEAAFGFIRQQASTFRSDAVAECRVVNVAEDVAVAGFEEFERASAAHPALTTARGNLYRSVLPAAGAMTQKLAGRRRIDTGFRNHLAQ